MMIAINTIHFFSKMQLFPSQRSTSNHQKSAKINFAACQIEFKYQILVFLEELCKSGPDFVVLESIIWDTKSKL